MTLPRITVMAAVPTELKNEIEDSIEAFCMIAEADAQNDKDLKKMLDAVSDIIYTCDEAGRFNIIVRGEFK